MRPIPLFLTLLLAQMFGFGQDLRLAFVTSERPGANCQVPPPESVFSIKTQNLYVWFLVNNVPAGTVYRVQWVKPDGYVQATSDFAPSVGGNFCYHAGWQPAAADLSASAGDWYVIILLLRGGSQSTVTTVPFRMTADGTPTGPPSIRQGGIAEPWTYQPGLSPGGWTTLFGANLAAGEETWKPVVNQRLSTTLGGVSVRVDGQLVPLSYVSPGIVNFLAPDQISEPEARIVVERNGIASVASMVRVRPMNPAIYGIPDTARNPIVYFVTAARAGTGELVGNPSLDPRVTRGARPAEGLDLYVVGLGRTSGGFPVDRMFSAAFPVAAPIEVEIGDTRVPAEFAGLISPGLYLVRFTVPADMPAGDVSIRLRSGEIVTADHVLLRIQDPSPATVIESLTLDPLSIVAGQSTLGTIRLSAPAPASVASIMMNVNTEAGTPIVIPSGQRTGSFRLTPRVSPAPRTDTVYARWNNSEKSARLAITAPEQSAVLRDYEITINGNTSFEGRQIPVKLLVSVPNILPYALVDTTAGVGSGVSLYAYFTQPVLSATAVTFSSIGLQGYYSNLGANVFLETITSGSLTVSLNSPNVGAPATGTIQFRTANRNITAPFTGTVLRSDKVK